MPYAAYQPPSSRFIGIALVVALQMSDGKPQQMWYTLKFNWKLQS